MLLLIELTGQVLIALMFKFDIVFDYFFLLLLLFSWISDCQEQLSEVNVLI